MPDHIWCRDFNDRTALNLARHAAEADQRRRIRRRDRNKARRHHTAALRQAAQQIALDASLMTACAMGLAAMLVYVL